jgi:catechol 2,3-dioxygenase-like lactoylglutathione lyase family enzyme
MPIDHVKLPVRDLAASRAFFTGAVAPFGYRLAWSPAQVDAFYEAAVAAVGVDDGAPGNRPYGDVYYAAFVFDPDGHNIEALYHRPMPVPS